MKKPLVLIMKNPGTTCNIGCLYCAEERKKFVSVSDYINYTIAEKLARLTKEYSLNVLFHGGEPTLLDCEYYLKLMNIFEKENDDVYFGIQTNGTKINDKWIDLLKNNRGRIGISISLDGPDKVNSYRLTKDKKETFSNVYANIRKLGENGIKTGLICTITSLAIGKERDLFNMLQGFSNLQFVKLNPCMDRNRDGTLPFWAVTPAQYFSFVENFFDIMLNNSAWFNFYIEPIISVLKNLEGVRSSFCNYCNEKCMNFISVYPDGTITSCDNYNLQEGFIGNLNDIQSIEDIRYLRNNKQLLNDYLELLEKCERCGYKTICKGGCIAIRRRYKDNDDYCEAMIKMIKHVERIYGVIHENS